MTNNNKTHLFLKNETEPEKTMASEKNHFSEEEFSSSGYLHLYDELQQGHWEECKTLITKYDSLFPGNSRLEEFKKDFEQRFSLIKNIHDSQKAQDKKSLIKNLKKLGLIAAILILIGAMIWGGYSMISSYNLSNQKANNQNQITILSAQAENLLLSGQPEKAKEIIEMMKKIDPANSKVIELSQKTDAFLQINALYEKAQNEITQGQKDLALADLQKIENAYPSYRDVPQLIETLSNQITIEKAYKDASEAFQLSDWQKAIDNFETIQTLNSNYLNKSDEGMLLNSYLHRIIDLLESNTTSFDDIDKAETYYRRAIAMIPQNQTYLTERENLQKISSDLLIMKYTQTALIIVNDPNQNVGLLTQALNYEKKAANLDSNNPSIQLELKKLTYYQAGFSYFAGMNWASAIEQLSSLTKIDPNYANGFAMQLLYEAYIARGNAYYDSGFYLDARNQFEAAESLSWDLQDKMNLFMVELDLAKTLGKLESYKDAASYYKYAVEAVDYFTRGSASPSFVNNLVSAITMYSDGQFEDSYKLFETTLEDKPFLFTESEFKAQKGMNIAIIAAENKSSVEAIAERNGLAQQTTITEDQTLFIPTLN